MSEAENRLRREVTAIERQRLTFANRFDRSLQTCGFAAIYTDRSQTAADRKEAKLYTSIHGQSLAVDVSDAMDHASVIAGVVYATLVHGLDAHARYMACLLREAGQPLLVEVTEQVHMDVALETQEGIRAYAIVRPIWAYRARYPSVEGTT